MTEIKLVKLRKEFNSLVAVNDLTLTIDDGALVSLLGPSGCGKTTTLRMIAGLTTPTSGEIYFDDRLVNDLRPQERKVGLVFQDYAIFPNMNAFDNIAFGLKIRGMPKGEIRKRVLEVAELLNIKEILSSMPRRMSLSELQSVALARTLVTNPSVLLLDEPLSNLDAALRARMRAELKRLQREIGQTVIYVTHDQLEAIAISDKIAVMNLGILHQYGTPEDIYNNPKTKFVAGFIGSPPMNFVECTFVEEDGGLLDLGVGKVDVSIYKDVIKRECPSAEVTLGVRPEDIRIHHEKVSKNSVEVRVEAYEPLGSEAVIDVMLGETLVRVTAPITFTVKAGDKAYIEFDSRKIHIIDRKTDKVII
ncbi:MAG: ABC transporter ATP-binding protein [Candidatus Bathyarchaeia archaeon]